MKSPLLSVSLLAVYSSIAGSESNFIIREFVLRLSPRGRECAGAARKVVMMVATTRTRYSFSILLQAEGAVMEDFTFCLK